MCINLACATESRRDHCHRFAGPLTSCSLVLASPYSWMAASGTDARNIIGRRGATKTFGERKSCRTVNAMPRLTACFGRRGGQLFGCGNTRIPRKLLVVSLGSSRLTGWTDLLSGDPDEEGGDSCWSWVNDAALRVGAVTSATDARDLAETMLAEALPRLWRHVRSVARRARWVAGKDTRSRQTSVQGFDDCRPNSTASKPQSISLSLRDMQS